MTSQLGHCQQRSLLQCFYDRAAQLFLENLLIVIKEIRDHWGEISQNNQMHSTKGIRLMLELD